VFEVEGLDCAAEVALIEDRLRRLPGVCSARASAATGQATVVHTLEPGAVERALASAGFRARERRRGGEPPVRSTATLAAFLLTLAGVAAGFASSRLAVVFYLPAILVGGAAIARKGLLRARQGALDMNALMTVAVLGAMAIGEWGEAASTVVLFSLAQLLEARSLERSRRAIGGLMSLAPEQVLVRRGGGEERVAAEAVSPGELMIVAPGERLSLDGRVETGASDLDQSPITGESQPVAKDPGDEVFAGSINGSGLLTVRVTRPASETTLARILRRVEEAQASRAPSQGFVDAFARIYTPAVVLVALLVGSLPPLLAGGDLGQWTYRALVLLVISCPCALVISTPVTIVSALTAASRRGVLVKGGAHLEAMGRIRAVYFDKTGTLTRGQPEVTDVIAAPGRTSREILALAAALEARSAHPIGEAVVRRAVADGVAFQPADEVVLRPGLGVGGRVDGGRVLVGSHRLFDEAGLCDHGLDPELERLEAEGKTAVLVGTDGRLVGIVGVADALRPEARAAVDDLRRDGMKVGLLTGDNPRTARSIASELGIEDARAELLPEDKVAAVREAEARSGPVAMVGDGINDAPALAAATVGIAMGGRSTDVALETADVALIGVDLGRIAEAVRLGRAARRVVAANVTLALGVKALVLVLALLGHGSLWAAVGADMGASLLVIGNGMRLLRPPTIDNGLPEH
jgi:Cd2+/Zn2+-exporting ATPase